MAESKDHPPLYIINTPHLSTTHQEREREMRGTTTTTTTMSCSLLLLLGVLTIAATAADPSTSTDFIRSSCRATRYPDLCLHSLASYAPSVRRSPRRLAHVALTVSSDRAHAAAAFVSRLAASAKSLRAREARAIRDCIETMADSVERLRRSVDEMGRLGRRGSADYQWHMSNVQTWVSAALTDESTCLDSLSQAGGRAPAAGSVRPVIRKKVVEVAHVTSNALALVNRVAL